MHTVDRFRLQSRPVHTARTYLPKDELFADNVEKEAKKWGDERGANVKMCAATYLKHKLADAGDDNLKLPE